MIHSPRATSFPILNRRDQDRRTFRPPLLSGRPPVELLEPHSRHAPAAYPPQHAAVAVAEPGECWFHFFASLEDTLANQDRLWGDRYEVWDVDGRRYELHRQYPRRQWWDYLFPRDRTFLAVSPTSADRGRTDATDRLRSYLHAAGLPAATLATADIDALVSLGFEHASRGSSPDHAEAGLEAMCSPAPH